MTTTCLPTEAYYHINRTTPRVKPRFQEPQDQQLQLFLEGLGVITSRPKEWIDAFQLATGKSFAEEYPKVIWNEDGAPLDPDDVRVMEAFLLADRFISQVVHRLFPFQYREMVVALTDALVSWSNRRQSPIPRDLSEPQAKQLLESHPAMVEWLNQQ
jgi:hypothetical protein